ncbi:MAG: prephenate dehydratase [Chloroflexi bacterium]|nr:prephenate dehydratase [Chloroflexota bacterium]
MAREERKRIAHLGPPGTFTEEAAILYDAIAQLLPFPSVAAVASAVDTGMADEGIVAIENSIEGSVTDTLDLLIHESNLMIRREVMLPISHCLLTKPGVKAAQVKAIFSHPSALGQCRRFIERCFPKAQVIASLSTTAAVEEMLAGQAPAAAIATQRAAAIYGAEILAKGIQDQSANVTRFVVLARTDHPPTGFDKTSLSFYIEEDRPGSLCEVLQEFSQRGINLAKIESRPSKDTPWRYFFLVDLEGHRQDPIVAEALARVQEKTALCKVFGSYPRHVEDS